MKLTAMFPEAEPPATQTPPKRRLVRQQSQTPPKAEKCSEAKEPPAKRAKLAEEAPAIPLKTVCRSFWDVRNLV